VREYIRWIVRSVGASENKEVGGACVEQGMGKSSGYIYTLAHQACLATLSGFGVFCNHSSYTGKCSKPLAHSAMKMVATGFSGMGLNSVNFSGYGFRVDLVQASTSIRVHSDWLDF
jgi:hypothetical protein